jgi:hypothetical protein
VLQEDKNVNIQGVNEMKSLFVHLVGLGKRRTLANLSVVMLGVVAPLAFVEGLEIP